MPAQFIIVIFRQDTCGTNQIFTEALSSFRSVSFASPHSSFLSSFLFCEKEDKRKGRFNQLTQSAFATNKQTNSPVWAAAFGASQTFPPAIRGPTFFGTSSQEMITYVRAIKFSIGYESVALTYQRGIDYIHLINKKGNVVDAEINTLKAALEASTVNPDTLLITDLINTEADYGWPITFVSYVLVPNTSDDDTVNPTICNELAATLYFVSWTGRSYMGNLLSNKHVEIPATAVGTLQDTIFDALEAIRCNDRVVFNRNYTEPPQQPIFPDYDEFPTYTPTSLEGLSPFYDDLGSPIGTTEASSYKFDDFGTSVYLQADGLLVPSDEISPDERVHEDDDDGNSSISSILSPSFFSFVLFFVSCLVLSLF